MDRLDALTVRESNGKNFWTRIGVAFPNKNGAGYIVRLDAMPASNEGQFTIHLREPRERQDQGQRGQQTHYKGQPGHLSGFDDDGPDDFGSAPF